MSDNNSNDHPEYPTQRYANSLTLNRDWPEDVVCAICEALEPDDRIYLNDRQNALRVLGFEEDTDGGVIANTDWPYHIWWLRGNGTEYRLRWSHTGEHYPILTPDSKLETRESYSVKHGEPRQKTIATSRGETVFRIQIDGIDTDNITNWVLQRQIESASER